MKKIIFKNQFGKTISCFVKINTYPNGRTKIDLIDSEDGLIYLRPSINLPELKLNDGEILIKDYSENYGILRILIQNEIVGHPKRFINFNFSEIPVCRLINVEKKCTII